MATPRPVEFSFPDEAEFITRFLCPLLRRLGYQIIDEYHGKREFGKDLIFGEVDRFGNVRYHGMQAKYVKAVGQEDSHTLVVDAHQAFNNPFRHPRTGSEERISTFYAVNGGSFSDGAREHFFNCLRPQFGANVVLLDGKSLLALDRWASANQTASVVPRLNGIRHEIEYNQAIAKSFLAHLENLLPNIRGKGGVVLTDPLPANRLRSQAIASFVEQPFVLEGLQLGIFDAYYECVSICNNLLNKCVGVTTCQVVERNITGFLEQQKRAQGFTTIMLSQIDNALKTLGPMVSN